jgi:RNA-binding protein YhbY
VRVFSDDRVAREAMFQTLADELSAAPIQHIGKLRCFGARCPMRSKRKQWMKTAWPVHATSRC